MTTVGLSSAHEHSSLFSKHRPLGTIQHRTSYFPSQSAFAIGALKRDAPGSHTYRPKTSLDALEEQRNLFTNTYNKARTVASAPPRQRTEPGPCLPPELSIGRQSRRLKNVQAVTDCFMMINVDKDLEATQQSTKDVTNKLHAYWKSGNNNLAVGKFSRGQKKPGDVPPPLDAWLTFGAVTSGDSSEGVIDAFTSFRNSDQLYNIEGSVGSQVAQQLQKGNKIRIGINGILQSQSLQGSALALVFLPENTVQVKKWKKKSQDIKCNLPDQVKKEKIRAPAPSSQCCKNEPVMESCDNILAQSEKLQLTVPSGQKSDILQQEIAKVITQLTVTIPLSWDDQCAKPNVKIIHANISPRETVRPVMSETFPIKSQMLTNSEVRARIGLPKKDGYKVKERFMQRSNEAQCSGSKIKVVYIDPLTKEEDERVNGLSIDDIVNVRLAGKNRENVAKLEEQLIQDSENGIVAVNRQTHLSSYGPYRANTRHNHSTSDSSFQGNIITPKLKTIPLHSAINHQMSQDLIVVSSGSLNTSQINNSHRGRKVFPAKPLHSSGAGVGSSIRTGPLQSETEYIKITSQLKVLSGDALYSPPVCSPYHFSSSSTTPQLLDNQQVQMSQLKEKTADLSQGNSELTEVQTKEATHDNLTECTANEHEKEDNNGTNLNETRGSFVSAESSTVAISIPTADELSDRESPAHSPIR